MAQNDDILVKFMAGQLTAAEKQALLNPATPPDASDMLVACAPADFSASAIARAVEDCDAQLLSMAVTAMHDERRRPVIALRVDRGATQGVARSLQRYGYETLFASDEASGANAAERDRARSRANELLHLLEI